MLLVTHVDFLRFNKAAVHARRSANRFLLRRLWRSSRCDKFVFSFIRQTVRQTVSQQEAAQQAFIYLMLQEVSEFTKQHGKCKSFVQILAHAHTEGISFFMWVCVCSRLWLKEKYMVCWCVWSIITDWFLAPVFFCLQLHWLPPCGWNLVYK